MLCASWIAVREALRSSSSMVSCVPKWTRVGRLDPPMPLPLPPLEGGVWWSEISSSSDPPLCRPILSTGLVPRPLAPIKPRVGPLGAPRIPPLHRRMTWITASCGSPFSLDDFVRFRVRLPQRRYISCRGGSCKERECTSRFCSRDLEFWKCRQ